jgi:hypothetical protein
MSARALGKDPADLAVFKRIIPTVVGFVMEKLSSKGIFQNTLSFAGRILGPSSVSRFPSGWEA